MKQFLYSKRVIAVFLLIIFYIFIPAVTLPAEELYRLDGEFFVPEKGKEVWLWEIPVSNERAFGKMTVQMDVTPSEWYAKDEPQAVCFILHARDRGKVIYWAI